MDDDRTIVGVTAFTGDKPLGTLRRPGSDRKGSKMIKNRELALIPDSALGLVEPPATSPTPRRTSSHATRPARTPAPRPPRYPERTPR